MTPEGGPVQLSIRIGSDGKIWVTNFTDRDQIVEILDDRPDGGYRRQRIRPGIETHMTPDAGKEAR